MGKNSQHEKRHANRRRKETKKGSIRNSKALSRMLDDSFPTTKDDEQRFADLSEDIVTTDWRAEARQPPDGSDFDPEEEEIYESRKLVMRQLVMNQLHQAPEDQLDAKSEADSWLEMEERFAEIYQPIPYNVDMDSWRTMTKEQMLQTVTSRRLRSQMKYMSRAEILGQIQTLKIQHQEKKKKQKESLYEDLPVQAKNKVNKKTKKVQLVTNQSSSVYQNTANYSGESLAEIYQAKVEARKQELRQQQQQQQNGLYVTRAMVHAAPSSDDERETRSPVRLSRADILSKYAVPAPITPQKRIVEVSRPIPDETIIRVEPIKAHPSSSSSSSCDGACCPGVEDCSMCSCSSCNSSSCCNSDSTVKEGQSSRIPASLVKQRRMEFERLRILEEQEVRLQELVRRQQIKPTMDGQGWLSLARKARQLEDRWTNRVRTSSTLLYEPIQVGINSTNNNVKKKKTKRSSKSKQRSRIIQQLRNKMRENMTAESMDPRDRQRRHMELKELLSDALHGGSQTLTNINLGLIYVPMEEQLDKSGALMSLTSSRTGLANSKEKIVKPKDVEEDGDESEDLFASIDTLIFEPKSVVEETSTSTIKSDELRDVEQRIAQQFDYLNDSQYGSGQDEEASASASTSSGCEECARRSDDDDQDDESKNGRRAAAAPAMVQTTAVTVPSSGLIKAARGEGSASCAAAASCGDSVYNDASSSSSSDGDGDSLTSFGSVIYQGQKLLQEEIQRNQTLPPPASASIDSELYEDTDASWDYYNPDEDRKEPSLLVGNLRKRPSSERRAEDEADETARLLESLRMAEDTHVSTSLRLIFPPSRDGTNFRIPVRKTSFIEMALENDRPSREIHLPTSPDSGFRSLPEFSHERVEPTGPPLPTGIRKRDTMIRELKTKLKDKFQPQDDVENRHGSSDPPSHQPPPVPVQQPSPRKKTALDKLGSILSTFNSFAQMEGQGRIYRKSVIQQQPQSLPAGINSSNAGYDIPSKHNPILSTGYPHHLLSSSEPTTIYDPSLPEDVRQRHHYDLPHQDDYPLPMEPLASLLLSNPYLHESLYNISEPLDEPPSGRKRKSRTRRRRETETSANWSDIEELIFGEEAALLSCPGVVLPPTGGAIQQHQNRMDPYHRDEWLFWDQLHQWRRTEMDRDRWEEERARRMLLWIHHSQSLEAAAASSSSIPHWWQV